MVRYVNSNVAIMVYGRTSVKFLFCKVLSRTDIKNTKTPKTLLRSPIHGPKVCNLVFHVSFMFSLIKKVIVTSCCCNLTSFFMKKGKQFKRFIGIQ